MKVFFAFALSAGILTSFVNYNSSSFPDIYVKAIAVKDTVAVGETYKAKLFIVNGKELGGTTPPVMYYMYDCCYNIFADGKKAIVKNDTAYVEFIVPDYKSKKKLSIEHWGARVTQQTKNGSDTTFLMNFAYAAIRK
ncbi:hypothetical protein [Cytophaga aurantiaca]|uniref:hypothetical protein n=1 Tax=Cytophaga aurantiaca TaxID=29530 RepID=UPI000373898A|nr:hypothetical protein [Cytophaga aurantiaca]